MYNKDCMYIEKTSTSEELTIFILKKKVLHNLFFCLIPGSIKKKGFLAILKLKFCHTGIRRMKIDSYNKFKKVKHRSKMHCFLKASIPT